MNVQKMGALDITMNNGCLWFRFFDQRSVYLS